MDADGSKVYSLHHRVFIDPETVSVCPRMVVGDFDLMARVPHNETMTS